MNSQHSYERFNWNLDLYKPIIKTHLPDILEKYYKPIVKPEDKLIVEIDDNIGGDLVSLGLLRPPNPTCNNVPAEKYEPYDLINFYCEKIENFINEFPNSYFCTFTVPPTLLIKYDNKKVQYGTKNYNIQLRFLRNKIYYLINDLNVKNYVIVFEITKEGQCHCHTIFDYPHHHSIIRNTYSTIMGFKTYDKMLVNCCVRTEINLGLAKYLCKI